MKLSSLHLKAFGPFADHVVDLGGPGKSLVLIYGPNEAGKSAMLRAIEALRYQIDPRSPDNFRHEHPDMSVGATLLKPDGTTATVMRIKRPKDSLRVARALGGGLLETTEALASSGIQEALTAGLGQEEYRRMFGLNHETLRAGGQRLARGEVELGTSLFEASLGVRDITAIAQDLDNRARELFMPGARGTKGKINEALKRHKELQREVKDATVKPRDWQDRFNASERARQDVQRLDAEQRALNSRQRLLATLRAAAPAIQELDEAQATLTEMKETPDLVEGAGQARTAAEASLLAAQEALATARAMAQDAESRLDALAPDPAAIAHRAAIGRLIAKAEDVDTLRRSIAQLEKQHTAQVSEVRQMAAAINASANSEQVLARAPAKARGAEVEQRVQAFVGAEQALDNHTQSAPKVQEEASVETEGMPPEAAIRQVRTVLSDLERGRNILSRLRDLPAEIAETKRALDDQLHDLGLEGEGALDSVRPVLDADIDAAAQRLQDNASAQQKLRDRLTQIEPELRSARATRDRMRGDQAVITLDDVVQARGHRDHRWLLVRATYVDNGEHCDRAVDQAAATASADGSTLPEVYEQAVRLADERADGYARDTKAAAELKAKEEEIARYERDEQALRDELAQLQAQGRALSQAWIQQLQAHGLFEHAPLALREWQGLLKQAREGRAALQRLRNEQQQALEVETRLASALRAALQAIDPGSAPGPEPITSLETLVREQEASIQRRQRVGDDSRARQALLATQARQWEERKAELDRKLTDARTRMNEIAQEWLLPLDVSPLAIRARIQEFTGLRDAQARADDLQGKLEQANASLAQIFADSHAVAPALGLQAPHEAQALRPWFDQLEQRRICSDEVQTKRQAAQRDLSNADTAVRTQETLIAKYEIQLRGMCEAAGVADVRLLPGVELQAERKRQASTATQRCLQQLRVASNLTLEELREQLAAQDGAALLAQEEQCVRNLEEVAPKLEAARVDAERTRRELEAVDASGAAAQAQEDLCQATASIESSLRPWMRLRLAHSLLMQAQRRFQERAQGPMLERASGYFQRMTGGAFTRLKADVLADKQVLLAERAQGGAIGTEAMSEGTRDQLYLALRLAAVSLRRDAGVNLPMVLDDVLMTSSDGRAGFVLQALSDFSQGSQVVVFTHHEHLLEVARRAVPSDVLQVAGL
uniref:SMC domain protein n=1 Tax=Variovorax paradoxus (strain S110) TaxID=543728 RepID=C5CL34_VARPS